MTVNPEKCDIKMWCLVLIVVAIWKHKYCSAIFALSDCFYSLFVRHLTLEGWSKCSLLPTIPAQSNGQHLSEAPFLTDNALCCITKYVMSKCRCLSEGMHDFRTSTHTKVFRFNQKFIKVLKCSAKFKCRPVGKIRWYWVWCTNPAFHSGKKTPGIVSSQWSVFWIRCIKFGYSCICRSEAMFTQ